jgi:hypothetical protein
MLVEPDSERTSTMRAEPLLPVMLALLRPLRWGLLGLVATRVGGAREGARGAREERDPMTGGFPAMAARTSHHFLLETDAIFRDHEESIDPATSTSPRRTPSKQQGRILVALLE